MLKGVAAWALALSLLSFTQEGWSAALPLAAVPNGIQFADSGTRTHPPSASNSPLPATAEPTVFTPPEENACHSAHDRFYSTEPGVYAFWPLCESTAVPLFYDLLGRYDWNISKGAGSRVRAISPPCRPAPFRTMRVQLR